MSALVGSTAPVRIPDSWVGSNRGRRCCVQDFPLSIETKSEAVDGADAVAGWRADTYRRFGSLAATSMVVATTLGSMGTPMGDQVAPSLSLSKTCVIQPVPPPGPASSS